MWIWTWTWTWTWTVHTNTLRDNENSQSTKTFWKEKKRMNWEWKSHGHHVNNRQLSVISGQFKLGNIFSFVLLNGIGLCLSLSLLIRLLTNRARSLLSFSIFRCGEYYFEFASNEMLYMPMNEQQQQQQWEQQKYQQQKWHEHKWTEWKNRENERTNERTNPCIPYSNISILCWIRFVLSGPRDQFNLLHIFNLFFAVLRKFDRRHLISLPPPLSTYSHLKMTETQTFPMCTYWNHKTHTQRTHICMCTFQCNIEMAIASVFHWQSFRLFNISTTYMNLLQILSVSVSVSVKEIELNKRIWKIEREAKWLNVWFFSSSTRWQEWDAFFQHTFHTVLCTRTSRVRLFIHCSYLVQTLMIVLKTIACSIEYVHRRPHIFVLHSVLQYFCLLWTFAEYFSLLRIFSIAVSIFWHHLSLTPSHTLSHSVYFSLVFMSLFCLIELMNKD